MIGSLLCHYWLFTSEDKESFGLVGDDVPFAGGCFFDLSTGFGLGVAFAGSVKAWCREWLGASSACFSSVAV